MSKYNNYGQFMIAVLEDVDRKCHNNYYGSSLKLFGLNDQIVLLIITTILNVGWPAFVAVCGLLILGPIAFVAALTAFSIGGIGVIVIAALAIYGGVQAIKLLYKYKSTPLAIYEVGKNYKYEFDKHKGDSLYIDNLIDRASNDIIARRS